MDWTIGLSVGALVYLAFAFDVAGFIARDELWLRSLMLIGSFFYLLYYYLVSDVPLWDAITTNGILAFVNLLMICVVVVERSRLFMTVEMGRIFELFPRMTPGQFRKLMKMGQFVTSTSPELLVEEGKALRQLFFVLDGTVTIEKNDSRVELPGGLFIGEVAFLTKRLATASVHVSEGARYIAWDTIELEKLSRRSPALANAILAHLNVDMAAKIANSQPVEA